MKAAQIESRRADPEVTVAVPVFNEKEGLKKILPTLVSIARGRNLKILIVDDGSVDGSRDIARDCGEVEILHHSENRGYGASIKTAVGASGSPWIIMMDSDGQHNPEDISRLLALKDTCDMVVGQRTGKIVESPVNAMGRRILSLLSSYVCGRKVLDFNSGLRLFRREVFMEFIGIYPDGFSISTTMTIVFSRAGYRTEYVPITLLPRAGGPSKVSHWRDGLSTLLLIGRTVMRFAPMKFFLPPAILLLLSGIALAGAEAGMSHGLPWSGVAVAAAGILFFFAGLLADRFALRGARRK